MDDEPGTYEEWRVTGQPPGNDGYQFTWSKLRNPHLGDPEAGARKFFEQVAKHWPGGAQLERRTIIIREWQSASTEGPATLG